MEPTAQRSSAARQSRVNEKCVQQQNKNAKDHSDDEQYCAAKTNLFEVIGILGSEFKRVLQRLDGQRNAARSIHIEHAGADHAEKASEY